MANVLIGYARVSTLDQEAGFAGQLAELEAAGCERIWSEKVSAVANERPQLAQALEFVREGDVFVVTRLDRLARSVADLLQIVAMLERKKVALRILGLGLDTSTATGRLILSILGAIGEFERSLMKERQRVGVAAAKAAGKYRGRVPTAQRQATRVYEMWLAGHQTDAIASALCVSRRSVQRILQERREG